MAMKSCIGKGYDAIWEAYKAEHGDNAQTRATHIKWKKLAAEVK